MLTPVMEYAIIFENSCERNFDRKIFCKMNYFHKTFINLWQMNTKNGLRM